jgi:hypothetical protein
LAADALRLLDLCNELLSGVQAAEAAAAPGREAATCPACGRELEGSPVRCRACGELRQQWHCTLWPCPGNLITGVGRTAREAIRNAREQAGVEIPR